MPAPLAETEDLPEAVIEAISLFNRRYYWETHEVLEHLWMDEQGPRRKFYQGIIQASAALYHVLNANPKGVIKLALEARNKLSDYRPAYLGIPLEDLCLRLEQYAEQARKILGREQAGFDYDRLPYLLIGHDMDIPAALRSP
jgi:predicted metal-dependent hydrolase